MSDHGFSDFYRQANLNTWLQEHGYLHRNTSENWQDSDWLSDVDWSRTRAFAIGLNSLYLNVAGRESTGIVSPGERLDLARKIAAELMHWTDDETGEPVVTNAITREEAYRGQYLGDAPDIIVGYGNGYRASWATTRGQTPSNLIEDNLEEWSGDHCVDPKIVPGVLVSNLGLRTAAPQLTDLTVGILAYFGIKAPRLMRGTAPFERAH
jgi:predicted AlkP superfamily phosphohydrolase/phosphomutase